MVAIYDKKPAISERLFLVEGKGEKDNLFYEFEDERMAILFASSLVTLGLNVSVYF